jgi:hypothetical protein
MVFARATPQIVPAARTTAAIVIIARLITHPYFQSAPVLPAILPSEGNSSKNFFRFSSSFPAIFRLKRQKSEKRLEKPPHAIRIQRLQ